MFRTQEGVPPPPPLFPETTTSHTCGGRRRMHGSGCRAVGNDLQLSGRALPASQYTLVAEFISTLSVLIGDYSLPKSVKCTHSAPEIHIHHNHSDHHADDDELVSHLSTATQNPSNKLGSEYLADDFSS